MENNIKDKKVLNVPNLRFPEFCGEWTKSTLSSVATVTGGGTPPTEKPSYWNGNIQWFTPTEVGRNKYISTSIRTISQEGLRNSSAKLLPANAVLLSSRATVGECSINDIECATNQGFQSMIAKENIYFEFLYYLALTKKKIFIKYACGSTFLEISNTEVKKIKCNVPLKDEQTKIAKLLSLVDERIETQNKIIDKLESLIKGMNATVLKLYTGDLLNLGSISTIKKGEQINGSDLEKAGNYYYMNGGITPSGYVENYNTAENTISISEGGNSCGYVQFNIKRFWSGGHCYTLMNISQSIKIEYLYFYLKSKESEIKKLRIGTGLPNIQKKDLSKVLVFVPSACNQQKIIDILNTITIKTNIESRLFCKYKALKQFLLKELFI